MYELKKLRIIEMDNGKLLKLYRMTDIFLLSLITNPLQRLFWSPSIASRGLKISASE